MKTTKKQFINLLKEVTDEVVGEALSAVVPRRPQESVSEAPQKNIPSSAPAKPVSNDIKQFTKEILEKIKDRQRKKGFSDMNIGEAIRQIIEFKMTKEGWKRTQNAGPGNSSTISDEEMDAWTDDPFGKKYTNESVVNEDRRKEANDKLEFEKWIKQFNPGLTPDNIAYDIAFEAWKAGKAVGYKSIQINPNWIKESSTSLDNYQIESADGDDISLLTWAQERLSRESNPNNIDVLEKVIALIQSGDAKKSSREKAAELYPNYQPESVDVNESKKESITRVKLEMKELEKKGRNILNRINKYDS